MGEEHYKKAVLHILQVGSAIRGFDAYTRCQEAHYAALHGEKEQACYICHKVGGHESWCSRAPEPTVDE